MKKCSKCDNLVFSKGLCKFHQPKNKTKNYNKVTNFKTEDFENLNISELKKLADYWLRQFLLEGLGNYILCPLKNKKYPREKMHVSHFVDRGNMCLRFSLENCHLISEESNSWDAQIPKEGYKSKHHYDYEMYLGKDKVENLKSQSENLCLLYKEDYIRIINEFKNGIKEKKRVSGVV